jgi:hypothetical protein
MQLIKVFRENECGARLAAFEPNGIDLRIVEAANDITSCLRFIDPYGDLVINQLQLPVLIRELQDLQERSVETDFRANIGRLIRFLEASTDVHVYVRFLGD